MSLKKYFEEDKIKTKKKAEIKNKGIKSKKTQKVVKNKKNKIEKFDIIKRNFEKKEIEVILTKDNDFWLTAEKIGIGLEYKNPRKSVMNLYFSHRDEIEEYKGVIDLMTPGGIQETTVFGELGAYLLIMFSNQPKAKEFRKWVVNVIKEIRKTGQYSENRLELIKLQSRQIIAIVDEMQNVGERVKQLEIKDKFIEIRRKTRNRLRKYNAYIVQEYGVEFWELWKPIRDKYEVSGYDDLSEEEGQEILRYYEEMYPKKKRTDKLDYFQ